MKLLAYALALLTLGACGSDPKGNNTPDIDAPTGDHDAAIPAGYVNLITGTWTLGSQVHDDYWCARKEVTEDMWISAFQAINPVGTHHQVLTVADSGTANDGYHCSASAGTTQERMLYASGVGTDVMEFQTGYAVHLKKGQFININLHLYNSSDVGINGISGVAVKVLPDATNVKEVGFMFGGTYNLGGAQGIPAGTHSYSGTCNAKAWKLFALWPHMHQIANHQKVELTQGGVTTPIHDDAYSFMDQRFYSMTPIDLVPGDQIKVTCTYNNTTGANVKFGDKSTDEMCFTGFYTSPPPTNAFECASF